MTLGAKLNTYIERLGQKQAAVATTWLEQWKEQDGNTKTWSDTTIISQLNRLVKDQEQGVRFFFHERKRGVLLLEVLQVPEAERPELFELAENALKTEGAPARIIIDATGWPAGVEKADALFTELKRLLILEGPHPITLVLLEDQYDWLPRSFDALLKEGKLRLELVKRPAEGWERARELAEEQGLVLSAHRFPDFERWLAADFDGRTLHLEPPQGLELFRTQGRLPALEPVRHDLSELRPGGYSYAELPSSACALHRLMRALRSEEASANLGSEYTSDDRLKLARALGIPATSTARERTAAAVEELRSALPVKVTQGSTAELEAHLTRARQRRVKPLALWVDDTVHLLNVPEAARLAEGRPWLQVHDIQPTPSALERLLGGVAGWSEFDFLSDPFLEHLLKRLDPEGKERTAFLHARAGLLLTQALQPKTATPVTDWKPALEELLASEPPAAQLRVSMQGNEVDFAGMKRLPFVVTQARVLQLKKARHQELLQVPPVEDILLDRHDEFFVVANKHLQKPRSRSFLDRGHAPSILFPNTPDSARDTEFWLDLHEACDFSAEDWQSKTPELWEKSSRLILGRLLDWDMGPLTVDSEIWEEADRELAMAWLALRLALSNPQTIRLPDGAVLMRLGGPFFAEIRITPLSSRMDSKQVQGSLLLDINFQSFERYTDGSRKLNAEVLALSDLITTHTVKGGYDFGARLPKRIHLLGERYCADIRFRGSALFSEASQSLPYAAAVARIEDEKRQAAEDDDDDE